LEYKSKINISGIRHINFKKLILTLMKGRDNDNGLQGFLVNMFSLLQGKFSWATSAKVSDKKPTNKKRPKLAPQTTVV
jgi:hypothetical protein